MKRALAGLGLAFALLVPFAAHATEPDTAPTPFIVVDQFGYLPDMAKVAYVRDPETGFDNGWRFTPGDIYQVVDVKTKLVVFEGKPTAWNKGAVDPSSGDHVWRFDFSAVTASGAYLIRDKQAGYDSVAFEIAPNLYRPLLVQAVRMLYYQRADFAKDARFAGANWADAVDHMGPGQDSEARLYSAKDNKSTARDLHGGWFDAGDYNRYTRWGGDYVVGLLSAYAENPAAFTDDFNIPESGNGIPDLLDEVKYEIDWLKRMQTDEGSALSVLGVSHASPPSAAKGPSYYGRVSTSATLGVAGAFAYASKIYATVPGLSDYAADLKLRAIRAWGWAQANPHVTFYNNDPRDHSEGLAAGQQEIDDFGRSMQALSAAVYLFDATGDTRYRDYVDQHYREAHLFSQHITLDFDDWQITPLLYYASLKTATPAVANAIRAAFTQGFEGRLGWQSQGTDPYGAYISAYVWGSNGTKANHGNIFADEARYGLHDKTEALQAAMNYLHYINGVNPLGKVYLTRMQAFGAENSVDRLYHTWYAHGTAWDSVSGSKYGPPPGYLVGGANPDYQWYKGCPQINPGCGLALRSPPHGQPPQKAYVDFNESWPVDSWEVTEPSVGYQTPYIRLLARFVDPSGQGH